MANRKHDHQFPRYFQSVTNLSLNERNNDIQKNYPIFSVGFVTVTATAPTHTSVECRCCSLLLLLLLFFYSPTNSHVMMIRKARICDCFAVYRYFYCLSNVEITIARLRWVSAFEFNGPFWKITNLHIIRTPEKSTKTKKRNT